MIEAMLRHVPAEARAGFRRLMLWTVAAAVAMVVLANGFLVLLGALSVATVIATTVGVFLAVMLGSGLMAMGFLSADSGHDEWAAHFSDGAEAKKEE